MSEQITLQVSHRVVSQATHIATRTQQPVEAVLASWLERIVTELPVETLSDEEVVTLTKLQLSVEQQVRLGNLLEKKSRRNPQPRRTPSTRRIDTSLRVWVFA